MFYCVQAHQLQESFDSCNKQPFQFCVDATSRYESSAPAADRQYFDSGPTETEEGSLYDVVTPSGADTASPYEIPSSLGVRDIQDSYLSP